MTIPTIIIAGTPPKPMPPSISQAEFDDMPIPAAASRSASNMASAASTRNFLEEDRPTKVRFDKFLYIEIF